MPSVLLLQNLLKDREDSLRGNRVVVKRRARRSAVKSGSGARCLAVLIAAGLLSLPAVAQNAGGELWVGDSGQPTYAYPISVPPGIAGMEPKLSLYYGGSSFNGPVGVGWSIQGFSEITRCGAIPAIDGQRRA